MCSFIFQKLHQGLDLVLPIKEVMLWQVHHLMDEAN